MISELVDGCGDSFTYLVGYSGLQLPDALARGAHGLMGGAGHPEEDLVVLGALRDGLAHGLTLFEKILPLLNFEMQTVGLSVAVHKRLLKMRGIIQCDRSRQPGVELDRFQQRELDRYWKALKSFSTSHR